MNHHPPVPISKSLATFVIGFNLVLAGLFAFDLLAPIPELPAPATVTYQPPAPLRRPVPTKLLFEEVSCAECHADMERPETPAMRTTETHADVVMNHATNVHCANCHHPDPKKYDVFVDHLGADIPLTKTELLCAKCHNQRFIDWQHGSHGKIIGYWDAKNEDHQHFTCIECHDPHAPIYPKLKAAPGPQEIPNFRK
jgi:hypothetical protein